MIDLKISSTGDFTLDNDGDLALTAKPLSMFSTEDEDAILAAQMAYMALKTELNDFLFHPFLGNELYKILGLPNKEETAKYGEMLIKKALKDWSVPGSIKVKSWPIEQEKIRFQITITVGTVPKDIVITLDKILSELGV